MKRHISYVIDDLAKVWHAMDCSRQPTSLLLEVSTLGTDYSLLARLLASIYLVHNFNKLSHPANWELDENLKALRYLYLRFRSHGIQTMLHQLGSPMHHPVAACPHPPSHLHEPNALLCAVHAFQGYQEHNLLKTTQHVTRPGMQTPILGEYAWLIQLLLIGVWFRWGSQNKHHKDTCFKEIRLHLQILSTTPHSTAYTIGRTFIVN